MNFSITEFAKVNRIFLIWAVFCALIYIMRAMFPIIFITFVFCFVTHGLSAKLHRLFKQKRRVLVIAIYVFYLSILLVIIFKALPRIYSDFRAFTEKLPGSIEWIKNWLNGLIGVNNPTMEKLLEPITDLLETEPLAAKARDYALTAMESAWHFVSFLGMGLLFSFLIMMDLPNLIMKTRALRYSKLAPVYDAMGSSVVLFAQVVGENFRAQILISFVNTGLTVLGLLVIGTGSVAMLAVVVFCCGLIPVLGVFFSSVPIILVAISVGGQKMVLLVVVLILVIHAVEAYVLNPRIVSAAMHINPVLTLMILYMAHTFMGLWGVLLGVPISVYFFRQITSTGHVYRPVAGNGPPRGGDHPADPPRPPKGPA